MNKRTSNNIIIILIIFLCVVSVVAAFWWLQVQASDELLRELALAQPGISLSEIRDQLGLQMGEYTDVEHILQWGNVKNESFCKDKKWFQFYACKFPCRTVEIYTDSNDVIVFATWGQL